jgi:transmembrane sensor
MPRMNRTNELLKKYKAGLCTPAEIEELLDYFQDATHKANLEALIEQELNHGRITDSAGLDRDTDEVYQRLIRQIGKNRGNFRLMYAKWAIAASIMLMAFWAGYNYLKKPLHSPQQVSKIEQPKHEILPGTTKAILTLGNGKQIALDNHADKIKVNQGVTTISGTNTNALVYHSAPAATIADTTVAMNTLTTPRGGQYNIVLPDGTRVRLNAASSITYPIAFTKHNRVVVLSGEAYFEVAKDKAHPFLVAAGRSEIRVLGTHFDISAYADDEILTTTLLEGSVQISHGNNIAMLIPGKQACIDHTGDIKVQNADIAAIMGWTNGLFVFNNTPIKNIMKIAARWYDVDITYANAIPNKKFGGTISRYNDINELLDNICMAGGLHYHIEGRRITIMN